MEMTRLNPRTGGGTSLDVTMSIGPSLYSMHMTSNGMLVKLADRGHPIREDKSLCRCYGRKNKSLAYKWHLGR